MSNKIAPVNAVSVFEMTIDKDTEKAREAVDVPVESVAFHELTAADLTLAIKRQELGALETNAEQIKEVVLAALPGYTPENYVGRIDDLKKAKAALNNAATDLNARRLQLERDFNKPFERFKGIIAETVKEIQKASVRLDEVVKEVESQEKETKRKHIDEYWRIKEFPFHAVYAKIFDQKWLNKTATKKAIFAELDAKCDKIIADIKILERFPAEDLDVLKAFYLDKLDLTKTFEEAERLNANRDAAAREAADREEREKKVALQKQMRGEATDAIAEQRAEPIRSLAAAALGDIAPSAQATKETTDPEVEFTLKFKGKASKLRAMREWMTENGILYEKIEG